MVTLLLAGILVLGVFKLGIPGFFLLLSAVNALVLLAVWRLRHFKKDKSVDN
ncbi:hypothetical protein [Marinobacter sp. F3R11]|uniref:hypothetical protein n=1 Tax=Marinobacter sp. F3R11 TaxID=2267231 RepID=UPI0021C8E6BC|nr:hypothetical protein [Marinobacter sp. F3R11]